MTAFRDCEAPQVVKVNQYSLKWGADVQAAHHHRPALVLNQALWKHPCHGLFYTGSGVI
jgi:hypothetical protein